MIILAQVSMTLPGQMANGVDGHWEGSMEREGSAVTVCFDFSTESGVVKGRFTSESQRALEYPLDKVAYSDPAIHCELGGSLIFDGVVSAKGITGSFREGEGKGTFSLQRAKISIPSYDRKEVTFRNAGAVLSGTLLLPRSTGPHPGIVFLHGSGPEIRWGTPLFLADRFARRGVAALVFDKRGAGQSTGDWRTVTFVELADDYLAAVRLVQQQPGVNPKQVGIYGHSQGGTISPLIASRSNDVAFVIAAAAIGGPAYEQDFYRAHNVLVDRGFNESEIAAAMGFYRMWITVARTGEGRNELDQAIAKSKNEKWFRIVAPPPKENWLWKWYPPVGNYNSLPFWEKIKVPVLLIYGERDRNTPVASSLAAIDQALRVAGNRDYTEVILPRAVHNLTIQRDPNVPFFWWHAAPGSTELAIGWVRLRFSGND